MCVQRRSCTYFTFSFLDVWGLFLYFSILFMVSEAFFGACMLGPFMLTVAFPVVHTACLSFLVAFGPLLHFVCATVREEPFLVERGLLSSSQSMISNIIADPSFSPSLILLLFAPTKILSSQTYLQLTCACPLGSVPWQGPCSSLDVLKHVGPWAWSTLHWPFSMYTLIKDFCKEEKNIVG